MINHQIATSSIIKQLITKNSKSSINLLFKNGKIVTDFDVSTNSTDFLKQFPRGAYTAMRTLHRHSVFQLKFHVHRLIYTTMKMINDEHLEINTNSPKSESLIEECSIGMYPLSLLSSVEKSNNNEKHELFLEEVVKTLGQSIAEYSINVDDEHPNECDQLSVEELKVTLLLVWYHQRKSSSEISTSFDLYSHITKLGERPSKPVFVDIVPGSRCHLGNAKDSIWITERNSMLNKKTQSSNEVLMCEESGIVREGTSSNFFIINRDGKVVTARDGILFGSVRGLLIPTQDQAQSILKNSTEEESCETVLKSSEYTEDNPTIRDLLNWKEAFITSTSRLVLPIKTINIAKECIDNILTREEIEQVKPHLKELNSYYYSYELESVDQCIHLNQLLVNKMQSMSIRVVN
ncbi:predicted protein [Naegleria gruberi]|uniref:Predicted protein n=1 Tax=Naegleria gruberi TaxID=5762 RepID=D2UZ14_NAEGR|nr:uncharacterized protein NAEGRDRAFT_61776 [Naegleria gruberi]EFC49866.1 predicted protein [Naegleria gruberi]|eukprot:XP_002682610.1 predicted protein [Naegleria gruberi strain NEG-M]